MLYYLYILKENQCLADRCSAAHRIELLAELPSDQGVLELGQNIAG